MLDNIYNRVLEKVVLPLGDKVEGGGFMPLLRRYRKEQWFTAEQLSKLQRERLSTVLEFARTKVSYYDELPASLSDPYEDIKQFPVL